MILTLYLRQTVVMLRNSFYDCEEGNLWVVAVVVVILTEQYLPSVSLYHTHNTLFLYVFYTHTHNLLFSFHFGYWNLSFLVIATNITSTVSSLPTLLSTLLSIFSPYPLHNARYATPLDSKIWFRFCGARGLNECLFRFNQPSRNRFNENGIHKIWTAENRMGSSGVWKNR